jgi:hypothetical protein
MMKLQIKASKRTHASLGKGIGFHGALATRFRFSGKYSASGLGVAVALARFPGLTVVAVAARFLPLGRAGAIALERYGCLRFDLGVGSGLLLKSAGVA